MNPRSPDEPSLPPEVLSAVAERFKVLGTLSRLKILNALMNTPLTVTELAEATSLEQSNLSRHLAELERAGCIRREREGRTVRVHVADPSLKVLCEVVCGSLKAQLEDAQRNFRDV